MYFVYSFAVNMRAIVILCGLFFVCCAEADPYARYSEGERACLEDLKLDVHKINKAFDCISYIKEGDEDVNSFMACCWKKQGTLTENGELNMEPLRPAMSNQARKLLQHPPDENTRFVNEIVDDCKKVKGADPGDLAVKVHNCINRHFVGPATC